MVICLKAYVVQAFLQKNSLGTIKKIANVCSVQFSLHSTHLLAFGSADFRTYCYDLRNVRTPWCVLAGHDKAVSHVKFLDSETLVTASTDNSLKIWDLNKTSCSGLSTSACSLTLGGHTNEKVGVCMCGCNCCLATYFKQQTSCSWCFFSSLHFALWLIGFNILLSCSSELCGSICC